MLGHFAAAFLATIQLVEIVGSGREGVYREILDLAVYKNNNGNLYPKPHALHIHVAVHGYRQL